MTQEELDALMAGDIDEEEQEEETAPEEEEPKAGTNNDESDAGDSKGAHEYRASAGMSWPPPPPTDDHKMVYQLDDVTRDSEVKAGEVFDKLESVSGFMMDSHENASQAIELMETNIKLFSTLCEKFPNVDKFSKALEDNKSMQAKIEALKESAQMAEDEIMMTMDIMQYQDIHRQKIERVINVMRALSKYMSNLFEGKVEDDTRVGSAVHIHGDDSTEGVVTNDDIEALIANLGKK